MPVAGVSFEWVDESQINSNIIPPVVDNIDRPIYMTVFTSDKGPEEWKRKVFGQRFFNLYGTNPSFRKHGQPFLQAAMISNAGGYQTSKRVVAEDSTLANLVLIAQVIRTMIAAIDPRTGNPIWEYTDSATGVVSQVVSATRPVPGAGGIPSTAIRINQVMIQGAQVDFRLQSYSVAGNKMNAFVQAARSIYDAGGTPPLGSSADYPLMIIADSGRGVSNKRIRIYTDTTSSTPLPYYRYFLEVSENGAILETIPFTMNPDINETEPNKTRPVNRSIETAVFQKSDQLRARFFDDIYWDFIENLEFITGVSDLSLKDPIFGYDDYRVSILNLNTNASPLLDSAFGVPLVGGGNGLFGNAPAKLARPTSGMNVVDIAFRNAFAGNTEDGDMIYDLDANRIDCIFDANYQQPVKRAIEQLVNFREDCIFFRDFGTENNNTIPQIKQIDSYGSHSRFIASYINYYRIYDPYTRKPIEVTVTYDLAQLFVEHFVNGRIRPFCGQKYGIVIPKEDYIDGSINFIPRNLPGLDQRKVFDDLRLNYINMYDGDVLTMETCYTSQSEYTQLSWLSNVLGVQEVIKAIRVFCPKERYTFLDGDDLVQYKKDVKEMVIDKYAGRFQSISIDYATNASYDSNKIIYAIIKIKFRNFIQTEKFKIICLQS